MEAQTELLNLHKVTVSSIKREIADVYYYSDDLAIIALTAQTIHSNAPTTIDGFGAVIMLGGRATVSIDMHRYEIGPEMVVVLSPGSIVRMEECSDDAAAYLVAFSKSFATEIQVDLSTALPVYMRFGRSPVLRVTATDIAEIRQLFQLMKTMLRSDKECYRREIIHSLFTTAFYIISELNRRETPSETRRGRSEVLFDEFLQLLQQHHTCERNVGFYAARLNITPKYLSVVVKEVSGKTAAQWIDEAVILKAKTLLRYSEMSVQEIAYRLHFSTQSFFGKYFKHHTGVSPSRYKRRPA